MISPLVACLQKFYPWTLLALLFLGEGCKRKPRANAPDFSKTNVISILLGELGTEYGSGLQHVNFESDGFTTTNDLNGVPCRCLKLEEGEVGYLYFLIDPTFKKGDIRKVTIEAEYFDGKPGTLGIEYDASDNPKKASRSAYTGLAQVVHLTGSKEWRTVAFQIEKATFKNSQNSRSDFRLYMTPPDVCVRRVTVTRGK